MSEKFQYKKLGWTLFLVAAVIFFPTAFLIWSSGQGVPRRLGLESLYSCHLLTGVDSMDEKSRASLMYRFTSGFGAFELKKKYLQVLTKKAPDWLFGLKSIKDKRHLYTVDGVTSDVMLRIDLDKTYKVVCHKEEAGWYDGNHQKKLVLARYKDNGQFVGHQGHGHEEAGEGLEARPNVNENENEDEKDQYEDHSNH